MFVSPCVLRVTEDDTGFALHRRLVYEGNRQRFIIPAGSTTDLGSIPRRLRGVVDTWGGGTTRCFVLHDFLRRGKSIPDRDADGILERSLVEAGVDPDRAAMIWAAVRIDTRCCSGATADERRRVARIAARTALPVALAWTGSAVAGRWLP